MANLGVVCTTCLTDIPDALIVDGPNFCPACMPEWVREKDERIAKLEARNEELYKALMEMRKGVGQLLLSVAAAEEALFPGEGDSQEEAGKPS